MNIIDCPCCGHKIKGVFHLSWHYMTECASCKELIYINREIVLDNDAKEYIDVTAEKWDDNNWKHDLDFVHTINSK